MSHCIERGGSEESPVLTKEAANKQFYPLLGVCRHVCCAIIGSAYGWQDYIILHMTFLLSPR